METRPNVGLKLKVETPEATAQRQSQEAPKSPLREATKRVVSRIKDYFSRDRSSRNPEEVLQGLAAKTTETSSSPFPMTRERYQAEMTALGRKEAQEARDRADAQRTQEEALRHEWKNHALREQAAARDRGQEAPVSEADKIKAQNEAREHIVRKHRILAEQQDRRTGLDASRREVQDKYWNQAAEHQEEQRRKDGLPSYYDKAKM